MNKLSARQNAIAKAMYNQLYYLANAERWATVYAENNRRARQRRQQARRYWSEQEIKTLRRLYPRNDTAWIAGQLDRSISSIYRQAGVMGLKKDPWILAATRTLSNVRLTHSGRAHRFAKGQQPANKGTRRPGWSTGRMRETWFRAGQRNGKAAAHHRPIGAERIVDGYRYVKVADVPGETWTINWKPVHILNWERANGRPLPEGCCLVFRDRDRMNVAVENLELITRADEHAPQLRPQPAETIG